MVVINFNLREYLRHKNKLETQNAVKFRKLAGKPDIPVAEDTGIKIQEGLTTDPAIMNMELKALIMQYIKSAPTVDKILANPKLTDEIKELIFTNFDVSLEPKFLALKSSKSITIDKIVRLILQTANEIQASTANLGIQKSIEALTAINSTQISKMEAERADQSLIPLKQTLIADNKNKYATENLTIDSAEGQPITEIVQLVKRIMAIDRCYNNLIAIRRNYNLTVIKSTQYLNLTIDNADKVFIDIIKAGARNETYKNLYRRYYAQTLTYDGIGGEAIKLTYNKRDPDTMLSSASAPGPAPAPSSSSSAPPGPPPGPPIPFIDPNEGEDDDDNAPQQTDAEKYGPPPVPPIEPVEPVEPASLRRLPLPDPKYTFSNPDATKNALKKTVGKGMGMSFGNLPKLTNGDETLMAHALGLAEITTPVIGTVIKVFRTYTMSNMNKASISCDYRDDTEKEVFIDEYVRLGFDRPIATRIVMALQRVQAEIQTFKDYKPRLEQWRDDVDIYDNDMLQYQSDLRKYNFNINKLKSEEIDKKIAKTTWSDDVLNPSSSSSAPVYTGTGFYSGGSLRQKSKINRQLRRAEQVPVLPAHNFKLYEDKYYIDLKKLDLGVLEIRYTKNKHLTIKPIHITPAFREIVLLLMHKKEITPNQVQKLNVKEQNLLKVSAFYFGLNVDDVADMAEDVIERWNIIKGEIIAGNNNVHLKKEAREYLMYFVEIGRINRHDYARYVNELDL